MSRVVLLCFCFLAACGADKPPAQFSPDTFTVSVHWETPESLRAAAKAQGIVPEVDGFANMRKRSASYTCDIHMVRIERITPYEQELLGHEFAHCLFGAYHN
jgi:hypothetical protein